jgi:hypothetical protein
MFNGRNRFNGFTTGKPVCVLRLDSAGTEVKRKNRALEIPHKLLIIKAFLLLTEPKTAVLEACLGRRRAVFCSLNFCHSFEPCQCRNGRQQEPSRARGAENGRRSNYLRAVRYSTPRARFSHRGDNCCFPIKLVAIPQGRNVPLSRRWHGGTAWISPVLWGKNPCCMASFDSLGLTSRAATGHSSQVFLWERGLYSSEKLLLLLGFEGHRAIAAFACRRAFQCVAF